jgi:hypothetical protein
VWSPELKPQSHSKKKKIENICNNLFKVIIFNWWFLFSFFFSKCCPPEYPSPDGQIKKMWCVSTIRYYSAIKKNGVLSFVTWADLQDMVLSKLSHTQKGNTAWSHLYLRSQSVALIEVDCKIISVFTRGWGRGGEGLGEHIGKRVNIKL